MDECIPVLPLDPRDEWLEAMARNAYEATVDTGYRPIGVYRLGYRDLSSAEKAFWRQVVREAYEGLTLQITSEATQQESGDG